MMNRRSAIYRIFGIVVVAGAGVSSWKVWSIYKKPDLSILSTRKKLIAEIAETIIPETDTPGAKTAKVEDFIVIMVTDCLDVKSQNNFVKGLTDLETFTLSRYNKPYNDCTSHERESILNHFEDTSKSNNLIQKVKDRLMGERFFSLFKKLTVMGFCTSKAGATEALTYSFLPSTFEPCISVIPNQKSWATK